MEVTVTKLDHLLHDLVEWEGFALQLPAITKADVAIINRDYPNNTRKQRIDLYTTWLQQRVNPSWEDVIKALESIDRNDLAQRVKVSISLHQNTEVCADH